MRFNVGGQDVSIARSSVKILNRINGVSPGSFTILDTTGVLSIQKGMPVKIYDDSDNPIYAGFVDSYEIVLLNTQGGRQISVKCKDNQYLATKRSTGVLSYTNTKAGNVVKDICKNILNGEGVRGYDVIDIDDHKVDWDDCLSMDNSLASADSGLSLPAAVNDFNKTYSNSGTGAGQWDEPGSSKSNMDTSSNELKINMQSNWTEPGYKWRKSHHIDGSADGDKTNYQVKIRVYKGSGSDSNETVYLNNDAESWGGSVPNDIRFRTTGGTSLDYWIEYSDSTYAVIWIEVNSIMQAEGADIYIYYGNASATDASNGDNTFPFFDHFSGSTLDMTKWIVNSADGSYTVNNSELYLTSNAGQNESIGARTAFKFSAPFAFELKVKTNDASGIEIGADNRSDGIGTVTFAKIYNNSGRRYTNYNNGSSSNTIRSTNYGTYQRLSILWTSSGVKYLESDVLKANKTTCVPSASLGLNFVTNGANNITVDFCFARKYTPNEPAHATAWGSREGIYYTTATWTSGDNSLSGVGIAQSSLISWNTSGEATVETSIDDGTSFQIATNGGSIPNITSGMNMSGKVLILRVTLSGGATTPSFLDVSTQLIAQASGSGIRRSKNLDLKGAGLCGTTKIQWTEVKPSGTDIVVEIKLNDGPWQVCSNGGSIPGLTAQVNLDGIVLKCRQTLSRSSGSNVPVLNNLSVSVEPYTIGNGPTFTEVVFGYESSCGKAIQALADKCAYWWGIDANSIMWFAPTDYSLSQLGTITQDMVIKEGCKLSCDQPDYRNRQIVKGGVDKTALQTQLLSTNGINRNWTLNYPLVQPPTVTSTGSSWYNDGVSGHGAMTPAIRVNGNITIVARVKLASTSQKAGARIIENNYQSGFHYGISADGLHYTSYINNVSAGSFGSLDTNEHVHVITYDGVTEKCYIDNVLVNTHTFNNPIDNTTPIYIGKFSSSNYEVNADIREVAIYGRIITDPERLALQTQAAGAVSRTGMICYYKCNEGTGSTLFDGSGNGTNATITGALWHVGAPSLIRGVGIKGADSDGTYDFYWNKDDPILSQDKNMAALQSSDTLSIAYVGSFPVVCIARADDEIIRLKTLEGMGSGIVDFAQNAQELNSAQAAMDMANGLLSAYANIGRTIEFDTLQPGFEEGDYATCDLPLLGINNSQMLITSVKMFYRANKRTWHITATENKAIYEWSKVYTRFDKDLSVRSGAGRNENVITQQPFADTVVAVDDAVELVYSCPVIYPVGDGNAWSVRSISDPQAKKVC